MRAVFVAAVLMIGLAMPAQANEPPVRIVDPVAGDTFVNPCTGETVTLVSGTFVIVLHGFEDSASGLHAIAEGNAHGVAGVGSTGTAYRAAGGFWAEFNVRPGSTAVVTITDVLQLISRGSGDNLTLDAAFHVTVNANGDPTAFVDVVADDTCRG
jgi:hypothetical protein